VALAQVAGVSARVDLPLIGMGGVASGAHAADLLAAGARAVGVGTESFRDPGAGNRIGGELAGLAARRIARPSGHPVESLKLG
jgi:dihydroorotate dehydrogenase (NAD+) catalytic subunit